MAQQSQKHNIAFRAAKWAWEQATSRGQDLNRPPQSDRLEAHNLPIEVKSESSLFLQLPGELRNRIYRLVLSGPRHIEIHSRRPLPPKPPLLSVNKQVRNETASIYYKENSFRLLIYDYDSTALQRWFASKQQSDCNYRYIVHDNPNWPNLLDWLEAFFFDRTGGMYPSQREDAVINIETRLFRMVRRLKNCGWSWNEVSVHLEEMHGVMAALDHRWK